MKEQTQLPEQDLGGPDNECFRDYIIFITWILYPLQVANLVINETD